MAENLVIEQSFTKKEKYIQLYSQLEALLIGETDLIARQSNFCAALKFGMGFFWVGFYKPSGDELILGPFQGPVACLRIKKGIGVCGSAWQKEKTIIVPDVNRFPGHIACSSLSKSEIVVPVFNPSGKVALILDVDHTEIGTFDAVDKKYIEQLVCLIYNYE